MNLSPCSCGHSEVHSIARRKTFDGIEVVLLSDGAVTGRMGFGLAGVPIVRPETEEARTLALRAGNLFLGEVEIHTYEELGALYEACRFVAARSGLPGDVRARFAKRAPIKPVWTVTATDRDGVVTERQWRLPRVLGAGLAVIDHVNRGRRGRYELVTVHPQDPDTAVATGLHFRTLDELSAHLRQEVNR